MSQQEHANQPLSAYLPALLVGLGSALLHAAVTRGMVQGFLVGYVPTMLLFALGWVHGARVAGVAVVTASLSLMLFAPEGLPTYLAADALPVLLMLRLCLTYYAFTTGKPSLTRLEEKRSLHLMPAISTGQALTTLCLYVMGMMLMGILIVAFSANEANLPTPISVAVEAAKTFGPAIKPGASPETLGAEILPLLPWFFGLVLWLWVFSIWGLAALSRYLVEVFYVPAPRYLGLTPFQVLWWWMPTLAAIGLVAAVTAGWVAIGLKTLCFLMLLPYFLSGFSLIMPKLPQGPAHRWIVTAIVLALPFCPWAALIFIAIGLAHPLKSASSKTPTPS